MEENTQEIKKGWSWKGFFFAPYYYAGYGNLKRGLIYAVVGSFPLFSLVIAFMSGRNANKDLPIGKQEFNWKNAGITIVVGVVCGISMNYFINSLSGGTPNCSANSTKNVVIQIAKDELKKQGAGKMIPDLSFNIQDIMTTKIDKELDIYQCSADLKITGIKNKIVPITYEITSTDDGEKFFVNVSGL